MDIFIYENYRDMFPEAEGRALTDALIAESLAAFGAGKRSVKRTEKGKPYVEAEKGMRDIYVSVSHSGDCFACLIDHRPVGIDIQQERPAAVKKIADRYFTEAERRYVEREGESGFFRIWTRKEAYAKLTGAGMEEILRGTEVIDRSDVEFLDFQLEKGMYCSCCMKI